MTNQLDRLTAALADRYRVERELGAGGMATVYLAQDLKLPRQVAIKVLRPELAASLGTDRFLQEIELTARLQHPQILPLHEAGEEEGFLYYVMPYVEGESLRDRLERQGKLPVEDAIEIADDIAAALNYADARGVVHCDIKPENVLLTGGRAVVADFGIARAITVAGGERLTGTGLALGTPEYMSPEQVLGQEEVDGRSDVYALGCVVYEMVGGRAPFEGATPQALIAKHAAARVPRLRRIDPAIPLFVVRAVERALAKSPADRFQLALTFAETLTSGTVVARVGGWGRLWDHPRFQELVRRINPSR
jgi:serine/threonine-protein kinase